MPPAAARRAGALNRVRTWLAAKLAPKTTGAAAEHRRESVAANYDSAQSSRHNQNHWEPADALSPNASNTVYVRRTMRNRSRYEAGSNPLYAGVLRTIAVFLEVRDG